MQKKNNEIINLLEKPVRSPAQRQIDNIYNRQRNSFVETDLARELSKENLKDGDIPNVEINILNQRTIQEPSIIQNIDTTVVIPQRYNLEEVKEPEDVDADIKLMRAYICSQEAQLKNLKNGRPE